MKKQLIPVVCIFHFCAIFWWTVPHSFGNMVLAANPQDTSVSQVAKWAMLVEIPGIAKFLRFYINATGSQQYWDFFAPHSVKYHQYLSVCETSTALPGQETTTCHGQPLFTNFDHDFGRFGRIGSGRSRLYRLTENLIKLEKNILFQSFTDYYRTHPQGKQQGATSAQLIAHHFELHLELSDLPKAGYRWDTLLLSLP